MHRSSVVLFALLLGIPSIASAQDPTDGSMMMPPADPTAAAVAPAPASTNLLTKEGWSTKIVDRPLGVSAGMLELVAPVVTNLSKSSAAEPISVPLVINYGLTDDVQLSLVHGTGLCVTGKSSGCAKAYNDLGFRGHYTLLGRGSNLELAAVGRLDFVSLDPNLMRAFIGPHINWVLGGGKALILSNPGVYIGLNKRDSGNKEALTVPVYAYLQATDNIAPYLFTGIAGPFDGFGDGYQVPLGVGLFYGVSNKLDVVAEFDFLNLGGKQLGGAGRADARQLIVGVNVRPL